MIKEEEEGSPPAGDVTVPGTNVVTTGTGTGTKSPNPGAATGVVPNNFTPFSIDALISGSQHHQRGAAGAAGAPASPPGAAAGSAGLYSAAAAAAGLLAAGYPFSPTLPFLYNNYSMLLPFAAAAASRGVPNPGETNFSSSAFDIKIINP